MEIDCLVLDSAELPQPHIRVLLTIRSGNIVQVADLAYTAAVAVVEQTRGDEEMAMLKIQQWRPDTHPGHIIEVEWEYDRDAGRDTGREHRGVSIRYPDGTYFHRTTHGDDVVHERYKKIYAEHVIKNQAYGIIVESLPEHMKKPLLDRDGAAVLDGTGRPRHIPDDKHRPTFRHLGDGRYEFTVAGIDDVTNREISTKLARFGERVVVRSQPKEDR